MRGLVFTAAIAATLVASHAAAAILYSENFNATGFLGAEFSPVDTSDRFGPTSYYLPTNFDNWQFEGGAYIARSATGDGAVLLNENGSTQASVLVHGLTPGKTYRLSLLVSGDNRPGQAYELTGTVNNRNKFVYDGVDGAPGTNPGTIVSQLFTQSGNIAIIRLRQNSSTEASPIIDNVTIAAVPEPASWALLIAGFGLVGIAVRRKAALAA